MRKFYLHFSSDKLKSNFYKIRYKNSKIENYFQIENLKFNFVCLQLIIMKDELFDEVNKVNRVSEFLSIKTISASFKLDGEKKLC